STQAQLAANAQAVADADIVVLGVKPPHIVETARSIADALPKHATVVSVAAGITLANLTAALPEKQPVIRTMPNVALTVGKDVLAIDSDANFTAEQVEHFDKELDGPCTDIHVVEDQHKAVTAIAGSGPGYVFHLANALAQAGTTLRHETDTAQEQARLTL